MLNHIEAFTKAIAAHLTPPDSIISDGTLHRYSTNGKSSDLAGYYVLHEDGDFAGGHYGCWRDGVKQNWSSHQENQIAPEVWAIHQQKMAAAKSQNAKEKLALQAEAKTRAKTIWDAATPASEHDYSTRKQIQPHGLRVDQRGDLLVPMRDDSGALCSLQTIGPDGTKRFQYGGKVKGCFSSIGQPKSGPIVVCEGFATGASIHEATGYAVAVAFNAGNVESVAKAIKKKFPDTRIIIAADDDFRTDGNPGVEAANVATKAIGASVIIPTFGNDRGEATDFNDLVALSGIGEVKRQFDIHLASIQIASSEWPTLDPLPDTCVSEPEPFPLNGLGDLLGAAATVIARDVQVPDVLAAGAVLASASLAVQPLFNVCIDERYSPTSLFIATSGGSGIRKSEADRVACKPILEFVESQIKRHAADVANGVKDEKGEPALLRTLTTGQGTVQALSLALRQQSHIGLFSSEGGELLGGHSLTGEHKQAGYTWFLKAWSGERLDSRTVKDGASSLLHRRVVLHVLIQPITLDTLLADPVARGNGFLARTLIAEPKSLAGTRIYSSANPLKAPEVKRYHQAIEELLQSHLPVWPDGDGFALKPATIYLEADAYQLWVRFYDEVEIAQGVGNALHDIQGFASKAPEQALRIAGVIAAVNGADRIDLKTMAGAAKIASFYMGEHLRLMGSAIQNTRLRQLKVLLMFLQEKGQCKKVDVAKYVPRAIRALKTEGIALLLAELTQRGYIRSVGDSWEARHVV